MREGTRACGQFEGLNLGGQLVPFNMQLGFQLARHDGKLAFAVPNSPQRRHDSVIVELADRIELVVVASRAVDGQSEKRLADHAYEVFKLVLPHDGPHGRTL